ncbi:MAG: STAS/SEC14 domain-containing protein [Pseudomonadota bacterium]
MNHLTPSYSVQVDEARSELHFKTSGLFDDATMDAFLHEVAKAAGPLLVQKGKIRAFGDLTEYVTQTREIGAKMAETLLKAEANGIEKTAIVIDSAILKMQYQRVSEGRNVEIFSNTNDALSWLRAP